MSRLAFLIVPFDALAILAAGASVVIALTGGGRLDVMGRAIRAHSVGNLLLFLAIWVAVRYGLRHVPLLRMPALPLAQLPAHALRAVDWVAGELERVTSRRALLVVCGMAAAVTLLKVTLALAHPGFFSGDDVEIHEMTLRALFHEHWPIWDLRSAFYPMSLIYPAQRVASSAGLTDTAQLVVVGRLVVVAVSTATILVLFGTARERLGLPTALVGALLLATSSLSVTFGATELPRPVAALLVFGAYASLSGTPRADAAALAGVLLGGAACLRFSEAVFLVPALVHLAIERRWTHGLWHLLGFVAAAGSVQFISDYWYWGHPFHSARAIVDYTLVDRLSSRGYDPWWYHARELTSWSDVLVIALAAYATRRNLTLALWTWLPIVVLSTLPHKEPRYLVPVVPMLSLLAAQGFIALLGVLRSRSDATAAAWALCLVVAVVGRVVDQTSKYHIVRSDREVRFAQQIAPSLSPPPVMAEQAWRFGGHLYLGQGRAVVDVGPDDLAPTDIAATVSRASPGLVLVSAHTCASVRCASSLSSLGFVEMGSPSLESFGYRLFRPSGSRSLQP
jgi:hypothetical protein